jgi:hypothetical protein
MTLSPERDGCAHARCLCLEDLQDGEGVVPLEGWQKRQRVNRVLGYYLPLFLRQGALINRV